MTKPSNVGSIEKTTGKPWSYWVGLIEEAGGKDLSHPEIVKITFNALGSTGLENSGWWAQNITVAYEQYIGRRKPGQHNDGSFELSVSRTFTDDRAAFKKVANQLNEIKQFNKAALADVRTSQTPVRSYWRCNLSDNSKLEFAFEERTPNKTMLTVTQTRLASEKSQKDWRIFWKNWLNEDFKNGN